MKDYTFKVPQDIVFGVGSLKRLPELLEKSGSKKMMVVSDRGLEKLGVVQKVLDIVEAEGIETVSFLDILPNPTVDMVNAATKVYKESGATSIVALGGGSPMDVAKAVGVLARYGGSITEYEGAHLVPGPIEPIIAIPTTAGTGSEVTAFSVITDTSRNYKLTVFSYELLPKYALLDPEMIMSVPPMVAASCGIDALIHALEAYVSNMASDYTDGLAEKAVELITKYLEIAYDDGTNKEAREKVHNASTIAGMAFTNAFLGVNHSLAHKIGGEFHLPHGRINAILLPYVIRYNSSKPTKFVSFPKYEYFIADKKYYEIAKKAGLKADTQEEGINSLIEKIKEMNNHMNIPSSFKEAGIDEQEFLAKIDMLADRAFEDQCTTANPRVPLVSELKRILLDSYYGKEC